jgi:hypothetical protein
MLYLKEVKDVDIAMLNRASCWQSYDEKFSQMYESLYLMK